MDPDGWHFDQAYPRAGRFDFPRISRQPIDLASLSLMRFSSAVKDEKRSRAVTVHFFENDERFDEVWRSPQTYLAELRQYYQILTPDFSLYSGMPITQQILNTFRNRWCGWFWQENGLTVIPSVSWSSSDSFDFCFDGLPQHSVVAVSTVGNSQNEEAFMVGFRQLVQRCRPRTVICYGKPFASMCDLTPIVAVPYSRNSRVTSVI